MANLKSSKKDIKRNAKRRAQNQQTRSALKTYVKKVRVAAAQPEVDAELLQKNLTAATKQLDKAAQRGIIHKNQAARRKSRLAKQANAAKAAQN
jgi:small subunit ribosomal protein S20